MTPVVIKGKIISGNLSVKNQHLLIKFKILKNNYMILKKINRKFIKTYQAFSKCHLLYIYLFFYVELYNW